MENKIITLFKKGIIDEEDLRKFHKKENEIITRAIGIVLESRGYVFDNSDDLNTFSNIEKIIKIKTLKLLIIKNNGNNYFDISFIFADNNLSLN